MLPPPGLAPSILENGPTNILSTAIASTGFMLSIGVDMPTSTVPFILATATAITATQGGGNSDPDNGECRLLGPFAILVQGALGFLALMALVYKRWRERPQRPLKIWFFDVSKQVVGSVLVHIANLLMSMLSSGQLSIKLDASRIAQRAVDSDGKYSPNPCSFYLLNLAIDTTIGIPILILLLRIFTALFTMTSVGNPPESIQSGNYGNPPRAWWWFKQSMIYFLGLMGMKICVLVIFLVCPWISRVGDWALRWTEGDEVLQVIFVMLVFPVIMNATQYYIIDSFIKNQKPDGRERLPDDDSSSFEREVRSRPYDPATGSSDEIHPGDEDDSEILAKADDVATVVSKGPLRKNVQQGSGSSGKAVGKRNLKIGSKDYDPVFDGESSPTVVGSASTTERERLVRPGTDLDSEDEGRKKSRT